MNVILLGPPGAGKGTQAKRLEHVLKLPHIASGDIFRAIRRKNSPLTQEVRGYMDRGLYVPDDLTIRLVMERLSQPDAQHGFLLDGFPRTIVQAKALDAALDDRGERVDRALLVTAPTEVLVRRLVDRIICAGCNAIYNEASNPPQRDMTCDVCGHYLERRSDEEPEVVRTRLDTYMQQTRPLVEFYQNTGILVEIDGTRSFDEVEAQVDAALGFVRQS